MAPAPAIGDTGSRIVRVKKPVTGQEVYEAVCRTTMADAKGGTGAPEPSGRQSTSGRRGLSDLGHRHGQGRHASHNEALWMTSSRSPM
jgi:hypothetical protein